MRAVGDLDPEPIEIASMQLLLSQIGRESEPELMDDRDRSSSSMALIELFAELELPVFIHPMTVWSLILIKIRMRSYINLGATSLQVTK